MPLMYKENSLTKLSGLQTPRAPPYRYFSCISNPVAIHNVMPAMRFSALLGS
jgi:hypothetical protein